MKVTRLRNDGEHAMQRGLFQWAAVSRVEHPELDLLLAIPNGGARSKATAGRLKAEGVKSGVPDVLLPVRRSKYAGLWLELKVDRRQPTEKQRWWHANLRAQGYAVHTVWDDWLIAATLVREYLNNRLREVPN